ncbi:MAG: ligase-associated DNA damage response endonuclease PdeM [Roseiflexaceae bacterium]
MTTDISTTVAGEPLALLPERALYWPRREMLIVADLHWGKAATFRAAGIPIPAGGTGNDLARLDQALRRTAARRLMLLGDLLHARAGRAETLLAQIAAWRARWPALEITLVRGNHDRGAGDPPPDWGFTCVNEPYAAAPFVFCHHPHESPDGYVLAGHVHPAVHLRAAGRQQLRLACFWFGPRIGVLPAFGSFTGSAVVSPAADDRVFALPGDQVIAVH